MNIVTELFERSPFGPIVEHTRKVHACAKLVRPLAEALVREDYEEIHRLQDEVSRLEYEADQIKHEIRAVLPQRYFLAVGREELDHFLRCQDRIADSVEDFAVILLIRNTKLHSSLREPFLAFVDQVLQVNETLMTAAEELLNLVETAFAGEEAEMVLKHIASLGEKEWQADRMQRELCTTIYRAEDEVDAVSIMFYDKMLRALSSIANEAENTGDLLRLMIVQGG